MRKIRKGLLLILIFALLFTVACSKGDKDDKGTDNDNPIIEQPDEDDKDIGKEEEPEEEDDEDEDEDDLEDEELVVNLLNKTIGEIGDIYGHDYVLMDYLYLGGLRGFYYESLIVPYVFYYHTSDFDEPSPNEVVSFIEVGDDNSGRNPRIIDDFYLATSLGELSDYGAEYSYSEHDGSHFYLIEFPEYYLEYKWYREEDDKPSMDEMADIVVISSKNN